MYLCIMICIQFCLNLAILDGNSLLRVIPWVHGDSFPLQFLCEVLVLDIPWFKPWEKLLGIYENSSMERRKAMK